LFVLNMEKMIKIPMKLYEELLEEAGISRNPEMMEAIAESDEAKNNRVETWELDTHL